MLLPPYNGAFFILHLVYFLSITNPRSMAKKFILEHVYLSDPIHEIIGNVFGWEKETVKVLNVLRQQVPRSPKFEQFNGCSYLSASCCIIEATVDEAKQRRLALL
jgi:hypothetical protein